MKEPGEPKKIEIEKEIKPEIGKEEVKKVERREVLEERPELTEEEYKRIRKELEEEYLPEEEKEREKRIKEEIGKEEELEKKREERVEVIKEVMKEMGELPERVEKIIGKEDLVAEADREEMVNPIDMAKSYAGVASPLSRERLEQLIEDRRVWNGASWGLTRDNHPKAWDIRKKLEWHSKVEWGSKVDRLRGGRWAEIFAKLGLNKSERFFKLRDKLNIWLMGWPGFYQPGDILISTLGIGLDESEEKMELIERLKGIAPAETLICIAGDDSEKANKLRKELGSIVPWAEEISLTGVKSEKVAVEA